MVVGNVQFTIWDLTTDFRMSVENTLALYKRLYGREKSTDDYLGHK